ncbi:Pyocin-S2 [compost metagenome]
MPAFLQLDVHSHTPNQDSSSLAGALQAYTVSANNLIHLKRQQIPGFSESNPEIIGPLSKPQLEALHHLVDEQAKRRAGPLWAEYHRALVLNESIRYLEQFSTSLTALQARAEQIEQLRARHLAEQEAARLAAEAKHRAREADRQRISLASLGSAASVAPLLTPIGAAAFELAPGAYAALQLAIRGAVIAMAASTIPSVPIVVGIVALVWATDLGNSERQLAISVPLADLSPPEELELAAIAESGGTLTLPYSLATFETDEGLHLLLTQDSGPIPVREAVFDSERQVYSLALDKPSRILTWTPTNAPGAEPSSPTALPIAPSNATIYTGSELTPQTGQLENYPVLDLLELDRVVVTFPADSGLAPILVMLKDRRMDPGVITGSGEVIDGIWLGEVSRGAGAAVPASIAEQLAGKEIKNFRELREPFWKAVGNNEDLSKQFSPNNIERMKYGYAPIARGQDWYKSHKAFILHHAQPISDGGAVYDLSNIKIVTPAAHQDIHYGEKP